MCFLSVSRREEVKLIYRMHDTVREGGLGPEISSARSRIIAARHGRNKFGYRSVDRVIAAGVRDCSVVAFFVCRCP